MYQHMLPRSETTIRAAGLTRAPHERSRWTERMRSAQRESNPRVRHGKAVGYRYIMGTYADAELSKRQSTGWDSNPRFRITGAESSPLDHQCLLLELSNRPKPSGTRGARTLTCLVKSQVLCR